MDVKKLEGRIKKLKGKLVVKGGSGAEGENGAAALRGTKKKLKRAQRRRRSIIVRAAFIEAKGQKKGKAGEGEKGTS